MSIYVFGSLAFDKIMTFDGRFSDVILPEKLNILNVCFLIKSLIHKRGGTAGNIAYSLALLDEKPVILASAGKDFTDYGRFLSSYGLPLHGIRIINEEFTASCHVITDSDTNQISGFHPAAMGVSCAPVLTKGDADDLLIVSPGNMEDMRTLPRRCKETGIRYIYDPGQQIPALSADDLLDGIRGSFITITNDYELEMVCRTTGRTRAELRAMTGTLITTLGEKGSTINNGEADIAAVPPTVVADPTGAGDAYRAGLIKGLTMGLDMTTAARMGATCSSFCVEQNGTQEHAFSLRAFAERHLAAFGEKLEF